MQALPAGAGGGGRTRTVSLPTDFEYSSSLRFEQFSVILCCFLFPILRCFTRHLTRKQAIMRRYEKIGKKIVLVDDLVGQQSSYPW